MFYPASRGVRRTSCDKMKLLKPNALFSALKIHTFPFSIYQSFEYGCEDKWCREWHHLMDGRSDVASIVAALSRSRSRSSGCTKPLSSMPALSLGWTANVAGMAIAHGAPLGKENVLQMKKAYGWDPDTRFHIPDKVKRFYADIPSRGEKHVEK